MPRVGLGYGRFLMPDIRHRRENLLFGMLQSVIPRYDRRKLAEIRLVFKRAEVDLGHSSGVCLMCKCILHRDS